MNIKKVFMGGGIVMVVALVAYAGVSIAFASLIFGGTSIKGDSDVVVDGSSTISIGTSTAMGITIGRIGATTTFPGNISIAGTCIGCFAAGGDLSGTSLAQTVTGIQGTAITSTLPTLNQVLQYNGSLWMPATLSTNGSTININTVSTSSFTLNGTVNQIVIATTTTPGVFVWSLPTNLSINTATATGNMTIQGSLLDGSGNKYISAPYTIAPQTLDLGAGTESSPWTNSTDHAAGIQTAINALTAARGGLVSLAPGRYDLSAPVTISTVETSVTVQGTPGFSTGSGMGEGTNATKVRANSGATSVFTVGGGSLGNEPVGVTIRDMYLYGTLGIAPTNPLTNNAGIVSTNYADQPQYLNIRATNFGVAVYVDFMDAGLISDLTALGNGYGIYLNGITWFGTIKDSQIGDNGYNAIYAGSSGGTDNLAVTGNHFVRNCSNIGCTSNAQVYWNRNNSIISDNIFQDAGKCMSYSVGIICSSSRTNVDELNIAGNYNTISGNNFADTAVNASSSCVKIEGNNNLVSGNAFQNCGTDITVLTGATDNRINQPGAVVSDSGTRTVINGVSTNVGDPNLTGQWNGVTKWAGLIIYDTTDGIYWLYQSSGTRVQLSGGATSFSAITSGTSTVALNVSDGGTLSPLGTGVVNANRINGSSLPSGATCVGTNSSGQIVTAVCLGSSSTTLVAAPPYLYNGTNYYVAATGYLATLPTSTTWLNNVAPSNLTFGPNGDYLISGPGNYWASYPSISSVEAEFALSSQVTGNDHYIGGGVWLWDSTNNVIWWFHSYIYTGGSGDGTGLALALENWNYNGVGDPTFNGSTNIHYPYFGGSPIHLRLSVSGGIMTSAVSFDGGAQFSTWNTQAVGTTNIGGYSLHGDNNQNGIMDLFSIKVQ